MSEKTYSRGLPRKPSKKPCENGLYDDGKNCLDRKACKRKPCPTKSKSGCLECGVSIVKMNEDDRLYCDINEEKVGKLCYKKCKEGYYPKGSLCVKGISKDIKNKIKSKIKVEKTGFFPGIINLIKETSLRVIGKKDTKEGFNHHLIENFETQNSIIDSIDSFLKDLFGKELEEYRWFIIIGLVVLIIVLLDYKPDTENITPNIPIINVPQGVKLKYNSINNHLIEEFLDSL